MSTSTNPDQNELESRLPDPGRFFPEELADISGGMAKTTRNGAIPDSTVSLVQLRAGQIAGSSYHTVRQTDLLRKTGAPEEKITAVASWRDAPYFSEAERAALELLEAVLSPNPSGERVTDELFDRVAAHYGEKALWTLIIVIGQICFFIPVAAIAKPIPGKPIGKNYSQ